MVVKSGAAFPTTERNFLDSSAQTGMTKREFFASQEGWPPESIWEHLRSMEHARMVNDPNRLYKHRSNEELVAEWRFKMADTMLAAAQAKVGRR